MRESQTIYFLHTNLLRWLQISMVLLAQCLSCDVIMKHDPMSSDNHHLRLATHKYHISITSVFIRHDHWQTSEGSGSFIEKNILFYTISAKIKNSWIRICHSKSDWCLLKYLWTCEHETCFWCSWLLPGSCSPSVVFCDHGSGINNRSWHSTTHCSTQLKFV